MTDTTWPPSDGLTTPRVPRGSAILTNAASATINAPASLVFNTVLDTTTYSSWCSFVPSVTVHSQPDSVSPPDSKVLHVDTSFTFHVRMQPTKKPNDITDTQLRIYDISTPDAPSDYIPHMTLDADDSYSADLKRTWRVSWVVEGGFVSRGLKAERFHEVIETGENTCEVRTWECQGGVLARMVKYWYSETLKDRFKEWCEDLKRYCEEQYANGKNASGA